MGSRMDKYANKNTDELPTRSAKNKELYRQVYNAYDNFENLIVPSNAREISVSDLKKEIASRQEYREKKASSFDDNQEEVKSDAKKRVSDENDEIYDINELINKAVSKKKESSEEESAISNGDYLKRLKLDNRKTNIEQVKELYEDIKEEALEEDESLLKTANLSLEILSDLKSDNDGTMVSAPIKNEEMPTESEIDFYSSRYKFRKKDFDDEEDDDEDDDDDSDNPGEGNGKFFLKVLVLIFGLLLIVGMLIFIIKYFNRV